ncbi:hypothetical protein ONZ45_g17061 [Pleurotus djamor]|nr:hypothetical protein ONZ45_g17061 [Pleurotus djamor]
MVHKAKTPVNSKRPAERFALDSKLSVEPFKFPFAGYTSIVGVHSTLLFFAALFLPRSTIFLDPSLAPRPAPSQLTSRDKPQHPFLEPLTLNPTWTMLCVCAGTLVLQGWWGGWIRRWWVELVILNGAEDQIQRRDVLIQRKLKDVRNAWAATMIGSFIFYAIAVLFGAPITRSVDISSLKGDATQFPITSHILHTYLLGLLLSILIIFPPSYTLGVPSLGSDTGSFVIRMTWVRIFAEFSLRNSVERAMAYPTIGALVGCWLGVIPIALDWDRPWQAWPLTSTFGAITGYVVGSITALTISGIINLADEHVRAAKAKQQ